MFKLFYKTLIHIFLWVILLVNLYLFFNVSSPLSLIGNQTRPNTYFGVTSLLDMFTYLPNTPLGLISTKLQGIYNKLFALSANFTNQGFTDLFQEAENPTTSSTFVEILIQIFNTLILILRMFASLFIGIAAVFMFFVYLVSLILSIFAFVVYMIQGMFARDLPYYISTDIQPYVSGIVNTPLLDFAVWGV